MIPLVLLTDFLGFFLGIFFCNSLKGFSRNFIRDSTTNHSGISLRVFYNIFRYFFINSIRNSGIFWEIFWILLTFFFLNSILAFLYTFFLEFYQKLLHWFLQELQPLKLQIHLEILEVRRTNFDVSYVKWRLWIRSTNNTVNRESLFDPLCESLPIVCNPLRCSHPTRGNNSRLQCQRGLWWFLLRRTNSLPCVKAKNQIEPGSECFMNENSKPSQLRWQFDGPKDQYLSCLTGKT